MDRSGLEVIWHSQVPPHLWAIAEAAYRNMLANKKVESFLIEFACFNPFNHQDNAMLITSDETAHVAQRTYVANSVTSHHRHTQKADAQETSTGFMHQKL